MAIHAVNENRIKNNGKNGVKREWCSDVFYTKTFPKNFDFEKAEGGTFTMEESNKTYILSPLLGIVVLGAHRYRFRLKAEGANDSL